MKYKIFLLAQLKNGFLDKVCWEKIENPTATDRQIPLRLQSPQFYIVKKVRVKRIHFRASKPTSSLITEWQIVRPVSSVKNARRMRRYLTSAHAQLSKLVRTCPVAVFISADASLVPRASCIEYSVQCTESYKTICIRILNLFKARKGHCLTDSLTDSKNIEFYALFA